MEMVVAGEFDWDNRDEETVQTSVIKQMRLWVTVIMAWNRDHKLSGQTV